MTLIELMVTLSVLTILVTIAVPSFTDLMRNSRLSSTASEAQSVFAYARSEAVMRRQYVTVCSSSNGSSCTGGNWQDGLLVFVDGGTVGQVDGSDQILKYIQLTDSALRINADPSSGFGSNQYVRFKANGGVIDAGALLLCDARVGNYGRKLTVYSVGRVEATSQQSCAAAAAVAEGGGSSGGGGLQ